MARGANSRLISRVCVALLFASHSVSAQKQCYYPNGEPSSLHFPCDPDADVSPCCSGSSTGNNRNCLENRLCKDGNGRVSRGACTDKDWLSPECNPICLILQDDGAFLDSCEYKTGREVDYCCSLKGDEDCCETPNRRFKVFPENPGLWARWDDGNFTVVGDVIPVTESSAEPTSATETDDLEAEPTTSQASTASDDRDAATTTDGQAEETGADNNDADSSSSELSTGAKAGIGVGAGVGALLLIAVIWLGYRNWQHRKAMSHGGPADGGSYHGQGYQQPPMQQQHNEHDGRVVSGYTPTVSEYQQSHGDAYGDPSQGYYNSTSPKYMQTSSPQPVEMSANPQDRRSELAG